MMEDRLPVNQNRRSRSISPKQNLFFDVNKKPLYRKPE